MNNRILRSAAKAWIVATVAASMGGLLAPARAADTPNWPRFRGPNGSGISADAFDKPIGEEDIAWKVELPGIGHSSPVVWGDKVYVTCAEKETAKRIVLCINSADGSIAWKREFNSFTFHQHAQNSYASSSPAVDDIGLYVTWTTPKEYILQALSHDGQELWRQNLGEFTSQWGSGTSPVVVNDMVILTNDQEGPESTVAAFDHKTGKQRWSIHRTSTDKTASSTPCVFTPKDGLPELILTSKGNGMSAVDPETGQKLWELTDLFKMRTIGSPIVAGDLVLGTTGDGSKDRRLFAIKPGRSAADTPEIAYKLVKMPGYVSTPIVKGDLLFMFCDVGTVTCVKASTGEPFWSEKPADSFFSSPICAGDTLWCLSHAGELVGISASDKYNLVSKLDLGEASQASPAVAGGKMYLRTLSHLICVGKK
jgi:outer membrane protein assembly factor BamB